MSDCLRAAVLQDAIALTTGDRNRTYGEPSVNLGLQMALWSAWKEVAGDRHSPAHDAAIQHVFAKLARMATGVGHRDNYIDAACYCAIAWECETRSPLLDGV